MGIQLDDRVQPFFPFLFTKNCLSLVIPVPGVVKRLTLRGGPAAVGGFEEDVIPGVRVEGRVEIDQVHAFGRDVVAQHDKVVAIVKVICHRARPVPAVYGILSGRTG